MQENRIRIDFGWKSFLSFFNSRPQARTCEKFWKKYILKIHNFYVHLQKQALKMQTNSIRINFGWKSFISFFGLRPQARTCEKFWKKYFENPPILCSIATTGPENAREQNSNRFLVEKVSFHFLTQGRRRGPAKNSEKNIFWKSTNFMFNSNSRRWECKRTELESILVGSSFISFFGSRPQALHRPVKKSEKNMFWKSTNFMFNLQQQALKMQDEQNSTRFSLKKFAFHFLASRPPATDLWKNLKKIYFENPQIWCSFAKAGPENAREQNSNWFCCKSFFHFLAQGCRRGPVEKFWKKYIWKIQQFHVDLQKQALKMQMVAGSDLWKNLKKIYFENPPILCSIATAGPENAREQNSNWFWLKKFTFHFLASRPQAGTCEKIWKKYILKIHQFYVQ